MDPASQAMVLSEDRRMYMEIKIRLERDPHIKSNLPKIVSRYEGIKPRARERICNLTELFLELEQRCMIRYRKFYRIFYDGTLFLFIFVLLVDIDVLLF